MARFRLGIASTALLTGMLLSIGRADAVTISRVTAARVILASQTMQGQSRRIPINEMAAAYFRQWPSAPGLLGKRYKLWGLDNQALTPRYPVPIAVSVTGISDVPGTTNMADVDFTWRYETSDSVIRRYCTAGGSGHAVLRLYDDGWRASNISLSVLQQGVPLTLNERNQQQQDIVMFKKDLAAQRASEARYQARQWHL